MELLIIGLQSRAHDIELLIIDPCQGRPHWDNGGEGKDWGGQGGSHWGQGGRGDIMNHHDMELLIVDPCQGRPHWDKGGELMI